MKPIDFKTANVIFAKDQPEYQPLPAHKSEDGNIITCWELDDDEIYEIVKNRRIYLSVMTFNKPLQPLYISSNELLYDKEKGLIELKK